MPGPDGEFGSIHPDKINDGSGNYFGLDPENDVAARDDIVVGTLTIPVNTPDSADPAFQGHDSLFLRSGVAHPAGHRSGHRYSACTSRRRKTGKLEIVCTQLCGLGHYSMKAYLQVMSKPDYDDWLKQAVWRLIISIERRRLDSRRGAEHNLVRHSDA